MSNPVSDLDRPAAQAWGGGGGGGSSGRFGSVGGDISDVRQRGGEGLDAYEVDRSEAIRRKGCWNQFTTCLSRMWATRQMTKGEDRDLYVRTTLRELVVYIIFLTILCIITFAMTSQTMYYYTKVLSDLFLDAPFPDTKNTFRGSTQVLDFWRFSENVLLDGLYWEHWYDEKKTEMGEDDRNILYENRLLGVPRYRQLRVRDKSCTIPPEFSGSIKQCYAEYSSGVEDTEPFGNNDNSSAWTYQSEEELGGSSHWGKLNTYSGAGSVQQLGHNKSETQDILADLRKNLWIQRATRAVFIDFTVYNANINLFCVIKLVFEFPPTGGVVPSWSFRTVKLLRYVTPTDYFVMACELIYGFYIFYYIIEESLEIKALKWQYFKSFWNILDLLVIGLSLSCIGFQVYTFLTISDTLETLLNDRNKFADFEQLGYWQTQFNSVVAVCVFLAWFKLFKYISFNKTMTQLSSTLSRCSKDVAGFAIMFFIVFFAFAQLGYLLFGTQVADFNTFYNAVFTLLRTILGDFNFYEIEAANRILGPIFFLCYVFFVFFVLLNMFLAIINDTYAEVKAEIASQRNEFEIADYFKRGYNNMLGKLGKRDKLIDIHNAIKLSDTNNDGLLTFDEIRVNLKKCNFSDMEIEMFFARYDTDGNRLLEHDEIMKMLADLEGQKVELEKQIKHEDRPGSASRKAGGSETNSRPTSAASSGHGSIASVSFEEFSVLQRRVDRLEHSIGSIVSKIDAVLVKLDSMEKAKTKRRETMSKMLDTITDSDGMDDAAKRQQMEKMVRDELVKMDDDRSPATARK